ncbi:MAG: hybrid sensor histidine kinase/response regulator [Proteobacteria bacterium]|nr:MAG: hybrid sensor histidine kinase/response regulator [Pseudomonadota bacterium]
MPHGHCYLWQPGLVGLHFVSDSLIGLAYLSISATLLYFVTQARDEIPFSWVFLAFGAFILACGATHFMEVWTMWTPSYWASGNVKLVTAIASVATAVAIPPLVPRALRLVRAEQLAEERGIQLAEAEDRAALAARAVRAQQEAEAARAEAEAANRAKDQFLATVSHELRNPLSPILAWSRMLASGGLDADRTRQAVEAIERCAVAQAQLIDDLLDVSRIVSGKLRMDVRTLDLAAVIDAAVAAARPAADAKQIRVEVDVDPAAGPVLGDAERMQQVVWNLLSNAVKATSRGGHVRIRLARVASHVELSVADDGAGIEPALLPDLFQRFTQGEAGTTRRQGGLGLGLAIVRHIVELHGGSVRAESDGPGRGARFHVALPLPAMHPLGAPPRRHPSAAAALAADSLADLGGLRVLVVDDEPDSNAAVQAVLARCGADVRVAASAQQALDLFERWRPDVLVSDIGMPVEDGYALIARIRALPPERGGDVPALALTAYARSDDRVRTLAAGFQLHLAKPVEPSELGAAVARLASVARARRT